MACRPKQLYLTHYSRVRDLGRLAKDMHSGIDAYSEMALANKDADDPYAIILTAMSQYLKTRAREHGFQGDDAALHSILEIDIVLNTKGLVSWLQRLKKQGM
jgi:hypothetical protein